MSIPEVDKRTSTHQVVKVTYDTDKMHKFMVFNVALSLLLIGMVAYMSCKICGQNEKITMLANMVNELNYKVQEQALNKPHGIRGSTSRIAEHVEFHEHLSSLLDESQQDIKKIKFHMSGLEEQIDELKAQIKTLTLMTKQQSKSSWEMKEIIDKIKTKLQSVSKGIQNIPNLLDKIPRPDFGSMTDKIKGTFDNFKESFGNMFDSGNQEKEDNKGKKKDDGIFDGVRDRFQRGSRSYNRPTGQQKQL